MSRFDRPTTAPAICLALLMLAAFPTAVSAAGQADETQARTQAAQTSVAEESDGARTCLKCHDEPPVTLILHTKHAQAADPRTPFANRECQTCHGDSKAHLMKPAAGQKRAEPDIVFGTHSPTPVDKQNEVCLSCHKGGMRMNWTMSQHASAQLSCASCHTPHALKDKILVKATQPTVCFDCHGEQRAQSMKRSHHPIREGKVVCSDCHNPHGSFGPELLVKNTVNETCFQCHAEKRGPFLWEHAPVVDDCTNCHTPHGSSQPRLLKIRTPLLCQTCHAETFHPSTLYSGIHLAPNALSSSSARLLAKGCLNCHPKVHGTNHPSGARLTR